MSTAISAATMEFIPCSEIRRFTDQPRQFFSKKSLESLKAGIEKDGQKRYAEVKMLPKGDTHKYELIDGERRWIVCSELQKPLWCLIRQDITDKKAQYLQSFLANGGQETLTDYETIKALATIKEEHGLTNQRVAELIGKSEDWVRERIALMKFGSAFLELMSPEQPDGKRLPFTHAQLISRVPRHGRAKLVEIVLRDRLAPNQIKELVRKNSKLLSKGGFEYVKWMSLAKRIRDDAEALKDKSRNSEAVLGGRPSEDVTNMLQRVNSAMGDLAILKKTLAQILVRKEAALQVSKSA